MNVETLNQMRGKDELLIYLDLDGVVQHEAVYQDSRRGIYVSQTEAPGRKLFEWVPLLVELLRPYPAVRLVLSSSWCRRPGYSRTLKRLPAELRARFVGGTFHRSIHGIDPWLEQSFAATPRGVQITNDVARRQPRDWLALDDDDRGWPAEHLDHLVKCNGSLGLSDQATQQELTRRLSYMCYSLGPPGWTWKDVDDHIRKRLNAADMLVVDQVAQLLDLTGEAIEDLISAHQLLAIRAPGEAWRLPKWQLEEPLRSVMPKILRALDTDGWSAIDWLETPLGGLNGLTPRTAIERGQGARVVLLARYADT